MNLLDWIIVGVALLIVWLGKVALLPALLIGVLVIVIVRIIRGERIP